ncbi:amidohydrolase [Microbacterium lacus]|uniref:amidohydrolase n=1 Tax=Microbacterium lacus TaxID=415217 RepID=UPI00384DCF61
MPESRVDVVFTGNFWTAGLPGPVTGAVGITGDVITAVEHAPSAVEELTSSARRVIETGDGLLLPGFQDAHVHPIMAGVRLQECALHDPESAEQFLDAIDRYARTHPDREWITGAGWTFAAFPDGGPRRELLDAICGGRPAALVVRDEHAVWVNTAALEQAGITSTTPDPMGGRIQRDRSGVPTGVLHEAAMALLNDVKPVPSAADLDTALIAAQRTLHTHGVTAWQDALVGNFGDIADVYDTYHRAAAAGRLTARVSGALFYEPSLGIDQIAEMAARRDAATGLFTTHTVKIMQDGIPENHTAAMHAPYLDVTGLPTDITGDSLIAPDVLDEVIHALQSAGFDMHFHTMGDRALTEVLNALEKTPNPGDLRHQIAHLQSVRPSDIARFAPLNVTANIQPLWAAHGQQMDHLCIPLIGAERADQQFPFADLARADVRLAAGSDWPVSDPSPMQAIHVAVNRVAPGSDTDAPVFIERQRLSLVQALTAYTVGGAYVNRLDRTGTIAPGMLADLTLLDRDPFTTAPLDLHSILPIGTFVGGTQVWAADEYQFPA